MLDVHEKSTTYCSFCPKLCRFACPVAHAEARETVTPQAKQALVDLVRRDEIALSADVADVFYRCTGCQLHTTACEHDIHVGPVMFDARAEAVKAGVGHAALTDLPRRLDEAEADHRPALRAACRGAEPSRSGALYFPGCVALEGDGALAAAGFVAASKLARGALAPADSPGCCGYPLLAGGFPEEFAERARRTAAALADADSVVTGDPICAWTLRSAYPDAGVDLAPAVHHLAEVASKAALPLGHDDRRLAYHDPCYLGRRLGVRREPREVIERLTGAAPVELHWAERGGYCSGGGGLLPETAPATAHAIAQDLEAQAADVGADVIVTACPRCRRGLGGVRKETAVIDLAELLAERLPG